MTKLELYVPLSIFLANIQQRKNRKGNFLLYCPVSFQRLIFPYFPLIFCTAGRRISPDGWVDKLGQNYVFLLNVAKPPSFTTLQCSERTELWTLKFLRSDNNNINNLIFRSNTEWKVISLMADTVTKPICI